MRIKLFFIFLLTFTFDVHANTTLKVFRNKQVTLPDSCYFIVRGGSENDFMCPNSIDRFRSVTFPVLENFQSSIPNSDEINQEIEEEGVDFYAEPVIEAVIDEKKHYLYVWHMYGKSHQSYTVCDNRSCLKVSAMEIDFVRTIIEQFSSKTIYDME